MLPILLDIGPKATYVGGCQHPVDTFPLQEKDARHGVRGQQPFNWTDYRPLLRAALVNLDR